MNGMVGDYIDLAATQGMTISVFIISNFSELPETGSGTEIYFTSDDWHAFVYIPELGRWADIQEEMPWCGVIEDPSEATEEGFYTIVQPGEKFDVYGIPNKNNLRRFYEHSGPDGWQECDSGERLMVLVDE
jgi:hypothetical protein